jgi:glycerophosphoryl diester phosphodiesterase
MSDSGMRSPFFSPNPVILAHRGDSAEYPENTLPAFESAQRIGVDVIETDVHLSRDGEVIIWHDETLGRTTDGTGPVERYTYAQLLEFDAAWQFTKDGGKSFPFRGTGVKLLRLAEALEKLPDMRFNVDLKQNDTDLADAFCKLVLDFGAEDRVLCASFHTPVLQYVRRTYPMITTSIAEHEVKRLLIMQKLHIPIRQKWVPGMAFQVPVSRGGIKVITPGFIRTFHRLGIAIQVWTINDESQMRQLLKMGVDGIFTDNPRLLKQVVADIKQ